LESYPGHGLEEPRWRNQKGKDDRNNGSIFEESNHA